jgi:hypothetical protein
MVLESIMPLHMVLAIQELRRRTNPTLFVAFDGQGDVENYLKYRAGFSNLLDKVEGEQEVCRYVHGYAQRLIHLQSKKYISWQVYLIHVCLALESVPIIYKDFYLLEDSRAGS